MRLRNIALLGAPAAITVGTLAWGLFAAGAFASSEGLSPIDQSKVITSEAKLSGELNLSRSIDYKGELDKILGSTSDEDFAKDHVNCTTLDREITSQLGFFTYEARMRAMANVDSERGAVSWFNSNYSWAVPVGASDAYADRSTSYLGQRLKQTLEDEFEGKEVNWEALADELKPTALFVCDQKDVYTESITALQKMDAEVARMIHLYFGN